MKDKPQRTEDTGTPDLNENSVYGLRVMQEVMQCMACPPNRRTARTFATQIKLRPARIVESPPVDKTYEHSGYAHLPRHGRRNQ